MVQMKKLKSVSLNLKNNKIEAESVIDLSKGLAELKFLISLNLDLE